MRRDDVRVEGIASGVSDGRVVDVSQGTVRARRSYVVDADDGGMQARRGSKRKRYRYDREDTAAQRRILHDVIRHIPSFGELFLSHS